MARIKTFVLASAVAIGAFNIAHAADLDLPPSPPVEAPLPPPVVAGWYLRGDVGYGFDQLNNFYSNASATPASVPGFAYNGATVGNQIEIDGGVGYQINNWVRFDVTGEYRTSANYWAQESYTGAGGGVCFGALTRCYDNYYGRLSTFAVLANGYIDLGTWWNFTPFIGAGFGGAFNTLNGVNDYNISTGGSGSAPNSTSASLAWALMAGVDYSFTQNWKLEVSYRYFNAGRVQTGTYACGCGEIQNFNVSSNEVRVGLRYVFAEVPAVAPPLVTKY
ncbi:MAG: outer membrane protein [Methylovirgula sp.]